MLDEDTSFDGPVPVAATTVRLVGEAEIELRRPRLHLVPLELRSLRPCPINQVSIQGRLPKPSKTSFTWEITMTLDSSKR